ncbi:helix-hairpin-helix domain-containing protein [Helicobacter sp. MIT 14-3879]|uniref:ComEA family DNA-binding protein n=1 Tax=Helicobacter sp. MIT 14-3879 TaxID=2040649 RepID=UPI000E1E9FCD|nr:helix-hairpin-helix domain-containing protein [Helicobacter sp. MIT 14-3879]RDU65549.1 DNA-binding protein [Helicobacter sp. MIT 14-3879]
MKKILVTLILFTNFIFANIDINTASKKELMTLEGIGAKKAEQIIEYREKNKFKSIDEIKNIKGIGDKLFNKIKTNITIDSSKKDSSKK